MDNLNDWYNMYMSIGYTPEQFTNMVNTYHNEGVPLSNWLKRNWLYENGYDLIGAKEAISSARRGMLPYIDNMVKETLGTPISNRYTNVLGTPNNYSDTYGTILENDGDFMYDDTFNSPMYDAKALQNAIKTNGPSYVYSALGGDDADLLELIKYFARKP